MQHLESDVSLSSYLRRLFLNSGGDDGVQKVTEDLQTVKRQSLSFYGGRALSCLTDRSLR